MLSDEAELTFMLRRRIVAVYLDMQLHVQYMLGAECHHETND